MYIIMMSQSETITVMGVESITFSGHMCPGNSLLQPGYFHIVMTHFSPLGYKGKIVLVIV